jgi:hypothetical protein
MATTLKIRANRLNILCTLPYNPIIRPKVWHFQATAASALQPEGAPA